MKKILVLAVGLTCLSIFLRIDQSFVNAVHVADHKKERLRRRQYLENLWKVVAFINYTPGSSNITTTGSLIIGEPKGVWLGYSEDGKSVSFGNSITNVTFPEGWTGTVKIGTNEAMLIKVIPSGLPSY